MPSATRRALLLIVFVAAVLRFVPIWFGLPYPLARPDEEVSIAIALRVLQGDLNPHFFHWPSLTFYVFAGVIGAASGLRELLGASGAMTFPDHALLTRATIALCGTITVFVLFRLGRRIAGDLVGLLAAAFLAVALLHVRESHFAMTDALMTLLLWTSLTLLVAAALADEAPGPPGRTAVLLCAAAGLAGGLATSTKYNAGAGAIAMVATQIVWLWRRPSAALAWRTWVPIAAFGAGVPRQLPGRDAVRRPRLSEVHRGSDLRLHASVRWPQRHLPRTRLDLPRHPLAAVWRRPCHVCGRAAGRHSVCAAAWSRRDRPRILCGAVLCNRRQRLYRVLPLRPAADPVDLPAGCVRRGRSIAVVGACGTHRGPSAGNRVRRSPWDQAWCIRCGSTRSSRGPTRECSPRTG